MIHATDTQITLLHVLIAEVEPDMVIPNPCSTTQANNRIKWLLKKKYNSSIKVKKYMT